MLQYTMWYGTVRCSGPCGGASGAGEVASAREERTAGGGGGGGGGSGGGDSSSTTYNSSGSSGSAGISSISSSWRRERGRRGGKVQAAARIALWVALSCSMQWSCRWRSRLSLRFLASCLRFCFWARQSVLVRGECGERRHGQQGTRQSWLSWQLVKQRHVVLGASAALLVARARLVWAMRCVAVRVCAGIGGAECQAGGVQRVREGRTRAHTSWEKKFFFHSGEAVEPMPLYSGDGMLSSSSWSGVCSACLC